MLKSSWRKIRSIRLRNTAKMEKKEIARDVLALGSWVFYFLVFGRALIKPYRPFVDQIVIAAIVLVLLGFVLKESDGYVARGLVLVVFTILFYEDNVFSVFAIIVFALMIVSSWYIGNDLKKIGKGLIIGIVGVLAGWYLSGVY